MAPGRTEVIDIASSDDESDFGVLAERTKSAPSPRGPRRAHGNHSRPSEPSRPQLKNVYQQSPETNSRPSHDSSGSKLKDSRTRYPSIPLHEPVSTSRNSNSLPQPQRLPTALDASATPKFGSRSDTSKSVPRPQREGGISPKKASSRDVALPKKAGTRVLEEYGVHAKAARLNGQLMPSSSNGVVYLKRHRDEEKDTTDIAIGKKKRKLEHRRRYSSSSPILGARPAKGESGPGLGPRPLDSKGAIRKLDAVVDLTGDDDDPATSNATSVAKGAQSASNISFAYRQRTAAALSSPRLGASTTTEISQPKSVLPSGMPKTGPLSQSGNGSRDNRDILDTGVVERGSEVPESLPGSPTTSDDDDDGTCSTTSRSNRKTSKTKDVEMRSAPLPAARNDRQPDLAPSKQTREKNIREPATNNSPTNGLTVLEASTTSAKREVEIRDVAKRAAASPLPKNPPHRLRDEQKATTEPLISPLPTSLRESSTEDNAPPGTGTTKEATIDKSGPIPKGLPKSTTEKTKPFFLEPRQSGSSSPSSRHSVAKADALKLKTRHALSINNQLDDARSPDHRSRGRDVEAERVCETQTDATLTLRRSTEEPLDKVITNGGTIESALQDSLDQARGRRKSLTRTSPQKLALDQTILDRADLSRSNAAFMTPDSITFQHQPQLAFANLTAAKCAEQVVGRYMEEMQSDNEHWIRTWLKRARVSVQTQQQHSIEEEPTDVFSRMRPLHLDDRPKKLRDDHARITCDTHALTNKSQTKSYTVPRTLLRSSNEDVPNYSHYVSIGRNFLAYNETTLQHWPYFGDEFDTQGAAGLTQLYYLDVVDRWDKLHRLGMAEHLAPYAEDMLKDIGCQWSDVLRFFLESSPDVGSDQDALKAKAIRDTLCKEDFTRCEKPWTTVLSRLPAPEPEKTGRAALLCERFASLAKLSMWQIARRCEYTTRLLRETPESPSTDELTCRVCMRYNCPYHGEIKERNDDDEDATAGTHVVETDIINPPNVNHRSRVGFPPTVDGQEAEPKDRRALKHWQTGANAHLLAKPDERGPFYPCHHPGSSCSTAKCSCFENKIPCEKTCGCSPTCTRKFQGCNCSNAQRRKGRKRVCFEEEQCACFQLGRECDPDLCGDCGVCEVLDPVNRNEDEVLNHRCSNASIQRGVPKHTILGDSAVHGLGLYACEGIREHDFIGEYKGEIITKDEAERRGAVYEHQKLSYLFTLNVHQEIDSTYFGNKLRFINHAHNKTCNLYPRIIMVNTVHRIALYGQRNIKVGEELFFDYGPMFPGDQLGGKTGRKTDHSQSKAAPHVRNAGLVKGFHDVYHRKDELGNRRAVKVTGHGGLKRKGRSRKSSRDTDLMDITDHDPSADEEDDDDDDDDDNGIDDNDEEHEGDAYGDLTRYNIVEDDTDFGRIEEDHDPVGDDDDFEPDDSVSAISEEAAEPESESTSEEDEEPIVTGRKRSRLLKPDSIRKQLEHFGRGDYNG